MTGHSGRPPSVLDIERLLEFGCTVTTTTTSTTTISTGGTSVTIKITDRTRSTIKSNGIKTRKLGLLTHYVMLNLNLVDSVQVKGQVVGMGGYTNACSRLVRR